MNTEQLRALADGVRSAHNLVVTAALGYRKGRREWPDVAEAIRREGDAVGRLEDAIPAEREGIDPDEARELARQVQWSGGL